MKKIILSLFLIFIYSFSSAYFLESLNSAKYLANLGIIVKKQDPKDYNLDKFVLRQEVAGVARALAGIDKKDFCDNEFKDVSATIPNTWACYSIEALRDKGLIAKNIYFNPEKNITKAESLGMMIKAAGFDYSYNPKSKLTWQEQLVKYANYKGIVSNFTDYNSLATRGWIFEVAEKSLKFIKEDKIDKKGNIDIDEDIEEILNDLLTQ